MKQACYYSATVAKAVLGSKTPTKEFTTRHNSAKRRQENIIYPVSGILFVLFALIAGLTQNIGFVIIGIFLAVLSSQIDTQYRNLKKEAKWFGL